jgi:kinetochore protein Nuf2
LKEENDALRNRLFETKGLQVAALEEVEKLKAEKNNLIKRRVCYTTIPFESPSLTIIQEVLNGEIESLSEAISRTNSRIVQSPERIRKTITTMSHTTMEDKRTVALNEAKARDLQAKVSALLSIEKVIRCIIFMP